jgi:hypothetical protein
MGARPQALLKDATPEKGMKALAVRRRFKTWIVEFAVLNLSTKDLPKTTPASIR